MRSLDSVARAAGVGPAMVGPARAAGRSTAPEPGSLSARRRLSAFTRWGRTPNIGRPEGRAGAFQADSSRPRRNRKRLGPYNYKRL